MKTFRTVFASVVVILVLTSMSVAAHAQEAEVEMVELRIRVLESVPYQKDPIILAQPRIMSLIDRPFWADVTPTKKSRFDQSEHEVGFRYVAEVRKLADKKYELKLNWFRGRQVLTEEDAETETFVEEKLFTRTILGSGETKKLNVSATKWYELTIYAPGDSPKETPQSANDLTAVPSTSP